MKPILFESNEMDFVGNGIGILADAASCFVTEEKNGAFELEMSYPISGIHYSELLMERIVLAKPNPVDEEQPFRIYRVSRPMGGIVTVYAHHISYDLSGIPVAPFTAGNAASALAQFRSKALINNPFTFWTDKTTAASFAVEVPSSVRSLLGGKEGSILDVYGGEYRFDRYMVRLYAKRGSDRGVQIRYGKNLTDIEQDENCESVYTGAVGYWTDANDGTVVVSNVMDAPGTYSYEKILTIDLSQDFEERPTVAQLNKSVSDYITRNNIGIPAVSLSVKFVQLEQTQEYAHIAQLERVLLCDRVTVVFPALGVETTAQCVKTVYNVLLGRYDSVELGDARANIAETIAVQKKELEEVPSFLQKEVDRATELITGNSGGYVVLHSSTGGKQPDEILIMDTSDIETATKVWRWNKSGLGYSATGYNGPYGLAMTQDGAIVADFITAGSMNAAIVKTGVLQSHDGNFAMDLSAGTIKMKNSAGTTVFSFDENGNLTIKGSLSAATGTFAGSLSAATGTFNKLTSTGSNPSIKFGSNVEIDNSSIVVGSITIENGEIVFNDLVTVDDEGLWIKSEQDKARFFMTNAPTATGGDEARWVYRDDYGAWSLGRYTSARSAKKHIRTIPMKDAWDIVSRLNPVYFRFRGQKNDAVRSIGFIAEEIEQICPELTTYRGEEAVGVQYSNFTALLAAALQEAQRRILEMEREIKELKQ